MIMIPNPSTHHKVALLEQGSIDMDTLSDAMDLANAKRKELLSKERDLNDPKVNTTDPKMNISAQGPL